MYFLGLPPHLSEPALGQLPISAGLRPSLQKVHFGSLADA